MTTHSGSWSSGVVVPAGDQRQEDRRPSSSGRPAARGPAPSPTPRRLASRKPRLTRCGLRRRKTHRIASISRKASAKPTIGETTIGMTTLSTTVVPVHHGRRRRGRADQPADQGVRGRRRQAEVPGDQVPRDRAEQRRPARRRARASRSAPAGDLAHGLGDLLAEEGADEVHGGREQEGHPRRQRPGRHRRSRWRSRRRGSRWCSRRRRRPGPRRRR